MRPISCAVLALLLLLPCDSRAQQRDSGSSNAFGVEPGTYSVGFRLLEGEDHTRPVTGGLASKARPRPVRTYLWYPAQGTRRAQPMRFGRYAALADDDVWPADIVGSLHEKLAYSRRPLARALGPAGFAALLERPVLAVENAKPMRGPFPLIVIGQGFWIEPAISLAAWGEYLAGRGFVVATAPLVGTNSPVVRVDEQDLETQVGDLVFVIARSRQLPFVSPDQLGVIGVDMGGMAGLLLAMRNRDVDVLVCLASGILYEHPSGLPRSSPGYDPLALRVPWLHITPTITTTPPPGSRAPSLFESARYSDRYLLLTPNMGHIDFTIDGLIEGRSANVAGAYRQETPTGSEGQRALEPYVFNFLAASLARDADRRAKSLSFLSGPPEQSIPGWKMTLEHRPAAPASMSYDEFIDAVVAGRGDEAIKRLRVLAAVEPNHVMLSESLLQRLNANLLFTWGLGKEAIPVIEFMNERYPPGAPGLLAEAHILAGNYQAATEIYSGLLERFPNNANVRSRLEWLRSR
jgi:hypothetical protein